MEHNYVGRISHHRKAGEHPKERKKKPSQISQQQNLVEILG
jgi:hypothetical protein